eukprot:TRINITY_DN87420_c0_g1_i1.p1 TRINITY_DN87420_c0_g1~~TRINITY_DN87420_c0_g1_i1.p1  ORF type:complete len:161 (+),score=21.81 TRINITY_DN87420_c0_g1_i1:22-504(+)
MAASAARQASNSALGSAAAFCSYLGCCHVADGLLGDPSNANGCGLAVAASVNFVLQRRTFAPGSLLCRQLVGRYVAAEALIVSMQQGVFVSVLPARPFLASRLFGDASLEEDPRLLASLRASSQAAVFMFVSFPLRRYFVFGVASPLSKQTTAKRASCAK